MPDITKCKGDGCHAKESCYRFTAKPSDYQSYFVTPPIKDGKCDHYWGENAEAVWNTLIEDVFKSIKDTTKNK